MTNDMLENAAPRKPRLALMGEFSAGKSTLANLLLGQNSSPVQVTATQLPPVWYRLGASKAERVTANGDRDPLPVDDWSGASPSDTQMISASLDADFLHAFDLIDMPGTSDPNMVPDFWTHVLPQVDLVIWCTPANQAWRQSEAALWEQVPSRLWQNSLLLVTRIDKIEGDRDRARVLHRVKQEANGLFREVLPIALTTALAGRTNDEVLEQTGAAAMVRFLGELLEGLKLADVPASVPEIPLCPAIEPRPAKDATRGALQIPNAASEAKIVPRRIIRGCPGRSRVRPEARSA